MTLESQVRLLAIEISLLLWADEQRVTLFSLPSSSGDSYLTVPVWGYRCGKFLWPCFGDTGLWTRSIPRAFTGALVFMCLVLCGNPWAGHQHPLQEPCW